MGTAGRKEDADKLSGYTFTRMCLAAKSVINTILDENDHPEFTLVSGGAAYSDFCAVLLYLENFASNLILHLPSKFDIIECYIDSIYEFGENGVGKVANHYHREFSKKIGVDSLKLMADAIKKGAKVVVTPGFKERNSKIAQDSDYLIAMSYGKEGKVKEGGTRDTVDKFIHKYSGRVWDESRLYHYNLNEYKIYKGY